MVIVTRDLLRAIRDWAVKRGTTMPFQARCEDRWRCTMTLGLVVPAVVAHELAIDCRPSAEKQRTFVRLALIRRVAYVWGFVVAQYCLHRENTRGGQNKVSGTEFYDKHV